MIAELKAEVQTLRQSRFEGPQRQQEQQQQQQTDNRVSAHSLETIHQRYAKVLQMLTENSCSMANAFRLSGCPRSTLRDFVAVAELRIVDTREHNLVIRDLEGGSVRELEAACRKRLRRIISMSSFSSSSSSTCSCSYYFSSGSAFPLPVWTSTTTSGEFGLPLNGEKVELTSGRSTYTRKCFT